MVNAYLADLSRGKTDYALFFVTASIAKLNSTLFSLSMEFTVSKSRRGI